MKKWLDKIVFLVIAIALLSFLYFSDILNSIYELLLKHVISEFIKELFITFLEHIRL